VPSSSIHPEGFGYLVPRSDPALNPEGVIGVVFDSTAIPDLDEPSRLKKMTKLTIMIGGPHWSTYPRSASDLTPRPTPSNADDLIQPALSHLHRIFPHLGDLPPPILVVPHIQKECIPTYLVGHGQRLKQLDGALQDAGWKGRLSVAGSGYGGVGVNDCVYAAQEVADGLLRGQAVTGLERWKAWV
jgi:oxygen-dependent protoporphyrinogen oxidase